MLKAQREAHKAIHRAKKAARRGADTFDRALETELDRIRGSERFVQQVLEAASKRICRLAERLDA
jgi:hypothetical protein